MGHFSGRRKLSLAAGAWAVSLYLALFLAHLPGDWGGWMCGPWGCAPPLQAVLACRLAWLLVIAPIVLLSCQRLARRRLVAFGAGLIAAALASTAFLLVREAVDFRGREV